MNVSSAYPKKAPVMAWDSIYLVQVSAGELTHLRSKPIKYKKSTRKTTIQDGGDTRRRKNNSPAFLDETFVYFTRQIFLTSINSDDQKTIGEDSSSSEVPLPCKDERTVKNSEEYLNNGVQRENEASTEFDSNCEEFDGWDGQLNNLVVEGKLLKVNPLVSPCN